MFDLKKTLALMAGLSAATLAFACGSDEDEPINVGEGGSGGAGGSGGSTDGGSANGGSTNGGSTNGGSTSVSCDQTDCQDIAVGGFALPPCCMSATQCGVDLGGTCTDPATVQDFLGDGGGIPGFEEEEVFEDSSCPDISFDLMGTPLDLVGCCDATGVCGVSTEGVSLGGLFTLPTMCVTNAEAGQFGGGMVPTDAAADQPCDYPGGSGGAGGSGGSGGSGGDAPDGG